MRTYARLQDGMVAETITTDRSIGELFHPLLAWVDITNSPEVQAGWSHDGAKFLAPAPAVAAVANPLAQLQAEMTSLMQRVAALAKAD